MSVNNDGGPAFPIPMIPLDNIGGFTEVRYEGMTLRDYFAAKAMQCFLSQPLSDGAEWKEDYIEIIATDSYEMADEMLKASGR